jgi:hypothetical protein
MGYPNAIVVTVNLTDSYDDKSRNEIHSEFTPDPDGPSTNFMTIFGVEDVEVVGVSEDNPVELVVRLWYNTEKTYPDKLVGELHEFDYVETVNIID